VADTPGVWGSESPSEGGVLGYKEGSRAKGPDEGSTLGRRSCVIDVYRPVFGFFVHGTGLRTAGATTSDLR
jgi:hypothetical protein